jgi:tetratricopeptide (TPR) repeat protein
MTSEWSVECTFLLGLSMPESTPRTVQPRDYDGKPVAMISSTTVDLPEHRHEAKEVCLRAGFFPLMMDHGSAEWDSDAIKYSLAKVDAAHVYIGIFAYRYGYIPKCPTRNPKNLSITELEYRHAQKRGIPILSFIAHEDHVFKPSQIDKEAVKIEKLDTLKAEINGSTIRGLFKDKEELRSLILQSLMELKLQPKSQQPKPARDEPEADKPYVLLPVPPTLYAVPNYILTSKFIGRSKELAEFDDWAKSKDPILVVDGIGGLGKSAVTWEWTTNHAPQVIANFAGCIWWSFYEKGTSMVTFIRHALAYVTRQDPDSDKLLRETSHLERGAQLLAELKRKPYLLVLDGFERVLTAYNQFDAGHIPDDLVDDKLRDCINPKDGDLLQQLLGCSPSKILISTRLFPSILQDRGSKNPAAGVIHHKLNGLKEADALELMKHAGITGDEKAMLAFANEFGRHSLVLKVVCGLIAEYRKKPYDFDMWRADPNYGGSLKLTDLDIKQKYTHILHFALKGLDEKTKTLLGRIAIISEGVDYQTLSVLNPFLPPQLEEVEPPDDPFDSYTWRKLTRKAKKAKTLEEKAKIAKQSADYKAESEPEYAKAKSAYEEYLRAVEAYPKSSEYRQGLAKFDAALKELEDRGLVQWDRRTNTYEMHPVVRGHAKDALNHQDKVDTFGKVRNHFESLPPDSLDTATELSHVSKSLEIYWCFVRAGQLDAAARFYQGELSNTLYFNVGAYLTIEQMLRPLFGGDTTGLPKLKSKSDQSDILNDWAIALGEQGRYQEALDAYARKIVLNLDERHWDNAATGLSNLSISYSSINRRAERAATVQLARELAEVAEDNSGLTGMIVDQMIDAINQGRFADAETLDAEFRQRKQPHIAVYRPGDAEYWRCKSQFFQGQLTAAEWQDGYDLATRHRNVNKQYAFLFLKAEWLLTQGSASAAESLEAIDQALVITNRIGSPKPWYHDLRAWSLALLNRHADARQELQKGSQGLEAAETQRILGDLPQARKCALNAYKWAWGEGPPYIEWYYLQRSKQLLTELGEPIPDLPPFDPSKVPPIPHEERIRAAIAELKAERDKKRKPSEA